MLNKDIFQFLKPYNYLISCCIPARLESSRLAKKLMLPLRGEPVIRHTIKRALAASCFDKVYCLTDSPIIQHAVEDLPCHVLRGTSAHNGTERIAKALANIKSSWIVNLQGDEPLFSPKVLRDFTLKYAQKSQYLHILVHEKEKEYILNNPNRVKVLFNTQNKALKFIRTIPKNYSNEDRWGIQLGIYGYSIKLLQEYLTLPPSLNEQALSHEILRWNPLPPIFTQTTYEYPMSLDTEEDWINIQKSQNFTK